MFEKFAALIFLVLLVGMVMFLTFVPLPSASEKAILMVIGGLMAVASSALPKLFGSDGNATQKLKEENEELRQQVELLEKQHAELQGNYDKLVSMLVERHVIHGDGFKHKTSLHLKGASDA